jgi:hypothetical protein
MRPASGAEVRLGYNKKPCSALGCAAQLFTLLWMRQVLWSRCNIMFGTSRGLCFAVMSFQMAKYQVCSCQSWHEKTLLTAQLHTNKKNSSAVMTGDHLKPQYSLLI